MSSAQAAPRGPATLRGSARDRRVQRVIVIEGAANAAIMLLKGAVGISTGSMAILSDAVHSLTDLANNGVAWIVVRWSTRPPDAEHPYGHRKFETVAVFLLAMLRLANAWQTRLPCVWQVYSSLQCPLYSLVLVLLLLLMLMLLLPANAWQMRLPCVCDAFVKRLLCVCQHTLLLSPSPLSVAAV